MIAPQTPLWEALEVLPGGRWHFLPPEGGGPLSMAHNYRWQIEGVLLLGESVSSNGVSYSHWYWHPGEQQIKMLALGKALEGDSLAEYTAVTRQDDTLICELTTQDTQSVQRYREEWRFSDRDHYAWSLYHLAAEGENLVMQANFERRKE